MFTHRTKAPRKVAERQPEPGGPRPPLPRLNRNNLLDASVRTLMSLRTLNWNEQAGNATLGAIAGMIELSLPLCLDVRDIRPVVG